MAKQALIQRELKRDKLVAKFAKKHRGTEGDRSNDAKKSDEERAAARLALQKLAPQRQPDPPAQPLRDHRPPARNLPPIRPGSRQDPRTGLLPATSRYHQGQLVSQAGEPQYEHE
jgi:hypothetical protein